MTGLLGDELCFSNDHYLVLRESGILLAGTDDLAHIGRIAVVQRQVEIALILGEGSVDDELLQPVDEVRLFALQDVDVLKASTLDLLVQRCEGNRISFYCHRSVIFLPAKVIDFLIPT